MKKNYSRREFVKQNALVALGAAMPVGLHSTFYKKTAGKIAGQPQIKMIKNEIILYGRKNNRAWFAPAVGVIPGNKKDLPQVFVSVLLLTGNDIGPQFYLTTDDLGRTWSNPVLCQNWFKIPLADHVFESPGFGFLYHSGSERFIALGNTYFVQDAGTDTNQKNERHYSSPELKGSIVYSLWNPLRKDFEPWERMKLPANLSLSIFSHGQFHEKEDGTILIPGYYRSLQKETDLLSASGVTVLRCRFNGSELQFIEHGSILSVEEARGLAEPSLIHFRDKYFMTVRHDLRGYVTESEDGLHFNELKTWCFDDGEELGNYNTQQKWLNHDDTLYLVYNRRSELNNGVFRSRAPLYMAQVDVKRLNVIRNTERIVFPEKGARMGNFNIANVADDQSWIITGEWLEGMFSYSKKGERFWVENNSINYNQYIGDLLLARVFWK
jgi:hypothetical protein